MVRGTRRWTIGVFLATALFAACGGGDDDSALTGDTATDKATVDEGDAAQDDDGNADADIVDGCMIVTAVDAEAILGDSVKEMTEGTKPQQLLASCAWEVSDDDLRLLQFYVFDGTMFYAPETYKGQPNYEEITGLGDAAFASGSVGVDLNILVEDRTVSLSVGGFDPNDPAFDRGALRTKMLDLAENVLDRI